MSSSSSVVEVTPKRTRKKTGDSSKSVIAKEKARGRRR